MHKACPVVPDQSPGGPLLERILTGRPKVAYLAGVLIWLAALAFLWAWWLSPDHVSGTTSFIVVSAVLAWSTLLPLYCIIIFYKSVRPAGPLRIPCRRPRRNGRHQGALRAICRGGGDARMHAAARLPA